MGALLDVALFQDGRLIHHAVMWRSMAWFDSFMRLKDWVAGVWFAAFLAHQIT